MSKITNAQRLKQDVADFGDPARKTFLVLDQADVDAAPHLINRAGDPEAVKQRITAIAQRKGLKLPAVWQEGVTEARQAINDGLARTTRDAFTDS